MNALYFYILILIHPYISFWGKSFVQAGKKSWEALIPGYNYFIAFKIACNKPWWSLLLLFPGVHIVMLAVLNVSYIRRFNLYSWQETLQGIFFPYLLFFKIQKENLKPVPETNWANSAEVSKRTNGDHIALFLALPVVGHAVAFVFAAISREKPGKKTKIKEWGDSVIFALVAALVIRTYVFEPFKIPTGSMEKTLLVGDMLFVNKLAYGPKVPVTPFSFPLFHNNVPYLNVKSYLGIETLNYTRLPGFSDVQRNDVVVFNYPSGDTAILDPRIPDGLMGHDYHGIVIREAKRLWLEEKYTSELSRLTDSTIIAMNTELAKEGKQVNPAYAQGFAESILIKKNGADFIKNLELWKNKARKMIAVDKLTKDMNGEIISHGGVIFRPVDKRENYIKRCVGIPGDWLEIKNSILYINDKPAFVAENQNIIYNVTNFVPASNEVMREKYNLEYDRGDYNNQSGNSENSVNVSRSELKKLKKDYPDAKFTRARMPQYSDNRLYKPTADQLIENLESFPKDLYINNTITDFERFQIPKKGMKIKINLENIAWYRRIITAYEGHTLKETKNGIFIDGKKATTYTFLMNYYWLMGDNRFKSADSRVWGFVPEDHVVGKASLVWFSSSDLYGVRWERLFKLIR